MVWPGPTAPFSTMSSSSSFTMPVSEPTISILLRVME